VSETLLLYLATILGFALFVTAHVTIVFGLATRPPRWRAPVALFVPPFAPLWAVRDRMRVRAVAWLAGAVVYVAALLASR
jgi:hypothetical protein